jgi:atypical dual specificity phosphatase
MATGQRQAKIISMKWIVFPRRRARIRTVNGFYWLIPRVLAGSGRPGGGRPENDPKRLDADLTWLRDQGIASILSLTETSLDPDAIRRHEFAYLHLPVVDMTPPAPAQLIEALAFIDQQHARDRPVLVHCLVGQGRTGTVLAAHLIRGGQSADRAIAELRVVCPHAVENRLQEAALAEYAARRDWLC